MKTWKTWDTRPGLDSTADFEQNQDRRRCGHHGRRRDIYSIQKSIRQESSFLTNFFPNPSFWQGKYAAINARVDQLTYDTEEDRNEAADQELLKYYGHGVEETPAGKEALFQLFLDNLDYTVLTECIEGYVCEPHIKLPLYD